MYIAFFDNYQKGGQRAIRYNEENMIRGMLMVKLLNDDLRKYQANDRKIGDYDDRDAKYFQQREKLSKDTLNAFKSIESIYWSFVWVAVFLILFDLLPFVDWNWLEVVKDVVIMCVGLVIMVYWFVLRHYKCNMSYGFLVWFVVGLFSTYDFIRWYVGYLLKVIG